jgi:multidrug efflux pump subunit AcrA (membrane-fusion protein)
MQVTLIALSTAFLLAGPQSASAQEPSSGTFPVSGCLITLINDVNVPAQEAGVLKELKTPVLNQDGTPVLDAGGNPSYVEVREGIEVVEGQLLGRIDDEMERKLKEVAQFKLEVAEKEARNTISVDYSKAAYAVAHAEVEQAKEANRRYPGTVPPAELNRMILARTQADLQIDQSEYELEINAVSVSVREAENEVAELQIARRQILAPVDGVVVERYVDEGEWVKPGDPVLRIVRINRVRIEGTVQSSRLSPARLRKGQRVTVRLDPDQGQAVPGHIVFVSPLMSTGARFEVWAEVENKRIPTDPSRPEEGVWLLSPGLQAEMTIHLD